MFWQLDTHIVSSGYTHQSPSSTAPTHLAISNQNRNLKDPHFSLSGYILLIVRIYLNNLFTNPQLLLHSFSPYKFRLVKRLKSEICHNLFHWKNSGILTGMPVREVYLNTYFSVRNKKSMTSTGISLLKIFWIVFHPLNSLVAAAMNNWKE